MNRFEEVIAAFDARALEEARVIARLSPAELHRRREQFLVPIGHDAGDFLNAFVRATGARAILEIGTAYGYSTVWLAHAAQANGGRVTSLECDGDKVRYAQAQLAAAGLDPFVDVIQGDASRLVTRLPGPWDFVLIDLWKELYVGIFDLVWPAVRGGGFIVADNMTEPVATRRLTSAYRRHVANVPDADTLLLPVGNGLELTKKR